MTLPHILRAARPSIRAVARPALPRKHFHVASSGCTSRLLQDDLRGYSRGGDSPLGESQEQIRMKKEEERKRRKEERRMGIEADPRSYKTSRLSQLRSPEAKEQIGELYPRLESKGSRKSIADFSQMDPELEETVTIYGRIQAIRKHSNKLLFVELVNEVETAQCMLSLNLVKPTMTAEAFKLFSKLIERGDHIAVTGVNAKNNRGQTILQARQIPELLAPAMEAIPTSLTDAETKSQKRHVDMLVTPGVADTIRLKSHIMQYMRDHFLKDDFLEVQTPILAHNAGGAVARPFTTQATEFQQKELSMRVAPELWLKRLVIGGLNKVFEMGPAFRNEGIDATHNPEFTMCEFYSAYTNLHDLVGITERLLGGLAERCNEVIATQLKGLNPVDVDKFKGPFALVEFIPELEKALGFRFPNLDGEDALPEVIAILKLANIDLPGAAPTSLAKLLDRLAAIYLEPRSRNRPIFIVHHPACMSPLSKSFKCPQTGQMISARAELFADGRELANMYEEENDPMEQERKLLAYRAANEAEDVVDDFEEDESEGGLLSSESELAENSDGDGDADPADKSYIKAMNAGLPPTGGWGCGVERLVMLFSGASRISDCLTFGTLRNVVGLTSDGSPQEGSKPEEEGRSKKGGDSTSQ